MINNLRSFIRNYAEDFLLLIGFTAILIGTYQISPIAAWFVGGAECLIAAFLVAGSSK